MNVSASSGLCSLPEDVAINCLAKVSRFDLAVLAMSSKSHRALVSSPKLLEQRRRMGCMEPCLYVCLQISGNPRWFVLNPHHRRLNPIIPWNPSQAPELSSFVVVDGGIYVLGGLINGRRTSDVWFLDCSTHTWNRAPSMKKPRASASANLIDGKIYVCGGCREEEAIATHWVDVFDLKSQTWGTCFSPKMTRSSFHQSAVIEEEKTVYAVNKEGEGYYMCPSKKWEGTWGVRRDPFSGTREDWCATRKVLFCRAPAGRILWCDPHDFHWIQVNGVDAYHEFRWKQVEGLEAYCAIQICRLCTNSAGNIVIFWKVSPRLLWSAEISLQRVAGEIWGKVEWSDAVFKLDDTFSSGFQVLYSASVLVSAK
ncbi:unnamed protein product [Eruca vesicaria subsp. sativa]|uniref:F-box domain-containing protein n=1 Tax=Eruca vesicaria subsp. sativa TaxID=29727 RepID=A0ABC8LAB5_ERUVS|nr:unnamed protein product [Eruca vesicaria subsp. sativa]